MKTFIIATVLAMPTLLSAGVMHLSPVKVLAAATYPVRHPVKTAKVAAHVAKVIVW